MKLQLHSLHFDVDQKLANLIQKKLDKLDTFFDKIIDGEVILKIEKKNSIDNKVVEIKINIPSMQLFAKERSKSFEVGIDEASESIRRQLQKKKEKMMSH